MSHEGRELKREVAKERHVKINVVRTTRIPNSPGQEGSFDVSLFDTEVSTINSVLSKTEHTFRQISRPKNIIPRPP